MHFLVKCLISGLLVGLISEIAKKSSLFAAFIASLPITSIIAFIWLYHETGNIRQIGNLSTAIAWVVLPSIIFFISFSFILKFNFNFYGSLALAVTIMVLAYFFYTILLAKLGISI